ncbi:MAG: ABC transporter permease [Paracoccaceae bacterium]
MSRVALSALLAHWRRHPIQLIALVVGLALATALWSGVQAINTEAKRSYAKAAAQMGQGTLDRLTGSSITTEDFAALRRAGWQVSPVLEGRLPGTTLTLQGIEPLSAPPQAGLAAIFDGSVDLGAFISEPGLLLGTPETAAEVQELGRPLQIIADIAPGTVVTDIGTAQRILGRDDISYLLIAENQPVGLPPIGQISRLTRVTPDDTSDLAQLTRSFHLNLTAFGFLSFAVGLFIVQSAIGLAFEQRRSTFRTLRALGVSLRKLLTLLGLELSGFALIAGLLGLALGYVIAATLLPDVAGTLRGLYGAQISGTLRFDPVWALLALAMTLAGAAAAGAQALWRVARMPLLAPAQPRAWARASERMLRLQTLSALALLASAALLAFFGGSLLAGFACLAALLLGAALALPGLMIRLLDGLGSFARTPLSEWLIADTRQQVPALSLALMALLLALSANVGVGTMVGSFRGTFVGWLDQRLASELYLSARSEDEAEEIADYLRPQTDALLPIWSIEGRAAGQPVDIYGIVDHATYRDNWPLLDQSPDVWQALADGPGVLINEQLARRNDLWPGDTIEIDSDWSPTIVGVYSDYGNPRGQVIAGFDALIARHPDPEILRYAVRVDPERAEDLARDVVDRFDLPPASFVNQADVKAFSMRVFEQTFLITGALNILTLAVAAFAMLTSLLTLSAMRLPQIAPVWALGQPPRRLARFELLRTALLALLTWAMALPVGLCLAWVLLEVVNVQAFGWRLPMSIFPSDWAWLGLWALIAATLAALWPVLRLTRLPNAALLRSFASDR